MELRGRIHNELATRVRCILVVAIIAMARNAQTDGVAKRREECSLYVSTCKAEYIRMDLAFVLLSVSPPIIFVLRLDAREHAVPGVRSSPRERKRATVITNRRSLDASVR